MYSSYLYPTLHHSTRSSLIKYIIKDLSKHKRLFFDTIATSGLSGNIIGTFLASTLNKNIAFIRKELDSDHCLTNLESISDINSYIIIDDLIEDGITINRIISTIEEQNKLAICQGIYIYNQDYKSAIERIEKCNLQISLLQSSKYNISLHLK